MYSRYGPACLYVVGLTNLTHCDAATIHATLSDYLIRMNLDIHKCRAQCYDGAKTFQGHQTGVATRFQVDEPRALHTHCYMHCVNLAVQDTVSSIPMMRDFLQFIQELINFLRDSPKRCEIVKSTAEAMKCPQSHVRPLCPTRFTVKFGAIQGLLRQIHVLPDALSIIESESRDPGSSYKASGFQRRMQDFEFFFGLEISLRLFEVTDRLSKELQSQKISAGEGVELVNHAISELTAFRCDTEFTDM